ncbi:MAG: DUF4411 family protein [Chlorobi bacterium]|nr:DUF4411 family protein [Chlorobiota bacterium]MCI0716528.1 DUF4411 family protein [Chlorobiota bacterium]
MERYCLDTNFFIEGWKYYSPDFCNGYWEIIEQLAKEGQLFIPEKVKDEIEKKHDNIYQWLKGKSFLINPINTKVQEALKKIYEKEEKHKRLVDSSRNRSEADPWVIAHAISEGATVVTKENKIINPNTDKIKIPNVCENMGVRWIDDFKFICELNIKFVCKR